MISCLDLKFQALGPFNFCYTINMNEEATHNPESSLRNYILSFIQTAKEEITEDRYMEEASKLDLVSENMSGVKLKAAVLSHIAESHPSISFLTARLSRKDVSYPSHSSEDFEWLVEHGGEVFNMDGAADMEVIRKKIKKENIGASIYEYKEVRQPGGLPGIAAWSDLHWWKEQMRRVEAVMAQRHMQEYTAPAPRQSPARRAL